MQKKRKGNLIEIYRILLNRYGEQGWWPVTLSGEHSPSYGVSKHNKRQKTEIIFSTVLAQNTQWKPNVERAITELNRKRLIGVHEIISCKHDLLARTIMSAGYYNQKAKKLKNIAKFLQEHPIEELEKMGPEKAKSLLLEVNGVGPETADSILLYALNKPVFVVDAYTRKIFSRIGLVKNDATYEQIQSYLQSNLATSEQIFNEFHALIVEHAKRHCKTKPLCTGCPLMNLCSFGQNIYNQ